MFLFYLVYYLHFLVFFYYLLSFHLFCFISFIYLFLCIVSFVLSFFLYSNCNARSQAGIDVMAIDHVQSHTHAHIKSGKSGGPGPWGPHPSLE